MRRLVPLFAAMAVSFTLTACADIKSDPQTLPQDLIKRATDTVVRFKELPELSEFTEHISNAQAVVILPTVVKAGFFGAGEVGHGMLLVKGAGGSWSYPAFYTLVAGSVGLQIGIQDTEIVLVIRNDKALRSILDHQGKVGADAGITVGIFGGGVEAATTTNLDADVLVFAHSKVGLFGGVSLEGAVLAKRNDFNEAYYGSGATPQDIVQARTFKNSQADPLREALGR